MSRHSLKTDMTPMVDLGFLLITFFVFTAELSKPSTMNFYLPREEDPSTPIAASNSLTILLAGNSKIFYYFGPEEEAIAKGKVVESGWERMSGISKVIMDKQASLDNSPGGRTKLVVLIKPGKGTSFKNAVDMLDEMIIHRVTRYAILKIGVLESKFLAGKD